MLLHDLSGRAVVCELVRGRKVWSSTTGVLVGEIIDTDQELYPIEGCRRRSFRLISLLYLNGLESRQKLEGFLLHAAGKQGMN